MTFLKSQDTVKLKLKKDRRRDIRQGYPWLFADCFEELPKAVPGSKAMVKDRDGKLIAFGMYDPESALAVRVLARDEERLDDNLIASRLTKACELRRQLFAETGTNAYRLINGEGDELPGLVGDRYNTHAVIKTDGQGPSGFWNTTAIAEWLTEHADTQAVYERQRNAETGEDRFLCGESWGERVCIQENHHSFEVDIVHGQKTGFFFDQRDNRARIGKLAHGSRVLNLFSYTGGFSIYAGKAQAAEVTSVDIAKPAMENAVRNWELNGLDPKAHKAYAQDCFSFLEQAQTAGSRWDLIIVDPPAFAHAAKHLEQAKASYETLFLASLKVLAPQGIIAFSSCSSYMRPESFLEICQNAFSQAKRRSHVLGLFGQGLDHPFPLACQELQYLKFFLFQTKN